MDVAEAGRRTGRVFDELEAAAEIRKARSLRVPRRFRGQDAVAPREHPIVQSGEFRP